MPITESQLLRIFPNASPRADVFVPALNRAMQRYRIGQAAFLAQTGDESAQLSRLVENLNYSAEGLAAPGRSGTAALTGSQTPWR